MAVVSDGSAVLGLGNIGPAAALPVMEGKSALFKAYGGLDSSPIVLDTKDPDEIVDTLVRLRPIFSVVGDDLAPDRIVPSPLDPRVATTVAAAVAAASDIPG